MPLFEYNDLASAQIVWLIISGFWMLRRNDEIPLLISFLLFYVTGYRYWAVTTGLNDWVSLQQFGIQSITNEQALAALELLVVAQTCFLGAYCSTQKRKIPILKLINLDTFLVWLRPKVILSGICCLPLVLIVRGNVISQIQQGRSLAFEISGYLYQFPFVLAGIATLIMCIWKFGGLPTLANKLTAVIIILGVANLTFKVSGRFQLIGWLATTAVIFSSSYKPISRLGILGVFLGLALSIFAIAGALRGNVEDVLYSSAMTRFIGAEDANMLDGFVLLTRFVPDVTPYRWGMTHLEILLRPIPRALWPDKPIGGGYMATVGLSDVDGGSTLGISPTFFGDLYSEGGWLVMLLLAVFYGIALAKLVQWSVGLHPFTSVLIRAIICAALVPVLRGGDMAGIAAWLGMAFWPCFLVLWIKRKELLKQVSPSVTLDIATIRG